MDNKVEIQICMGSSCFSRGNNKTLEIIKEYIKTKNASVSVGLKGMLCQDLCAKGPNIMINGQVYSGVTHENIIDILKLHFGE